MLGDIWKANTAAEKEFLHIWAEPAFLSGMGHVEMAFGMLRDMFEGLDLEINPESDKNLDEAYFDDNDIDKAKMATLQERCNVHQQVEFTKISNCFGVLVGG